MSIANNVADKGLVFKIYKQHMRLNSIKQATQSKNCAEDLNRHFSKEDMCVCADSVVPNSSETPWTVVHQAPLGCPRQEYWSGLPCSPPGNLPVPGIKSGSPALQTVSLPTEPPGKPKEDIHGQKAHDKMSNISKY